MIMATDCAVPASVDETHLERHSCIPMPEVKLTSHVQELTNRQIRDLQICCRGNQVIVTGISRTYYVKQLATQAVLTALPQVQLANEITVVSA